MDYFKFGYEDQLAATYTNQTQSKAILSPKLSFLYTQNEKLQYFFKKFTAPYGSFGQFANLRSLLDYFDNGVLGADNLDPILKENGRRIPLTEEEKNNLTAFMKTLSDSEFLGNLN